MAEVQEDLDEHRAGWPSWRQRWEDERKRVEEIRGVARSIEARYLEEKAKASANGQTVPGLRGSGRHAGRPDSPGSPPFAPSRASRRSCRSASTRRRSPRSSPAGPASPSARCSPTRSRPCSSSRSKLEERVIGQSHALEAIAQRIRTARANLTDPRRPIGVFLLVGPSGVGKTETALALADTLYGGERNLITINMSEYQEAHTVSGLKGSPPGYVGYGEGGVLTEAVRRRPYSVVLLDEVEKAHPDVLELFFQVFDKGTLEDGEGREIDFKNTVILLTSNVGTDTIMKLCKDPDTTPGPEALAEAIRPDLLEAKSERGVQIFKQAFLGRLIVVPYYPISDDVMRQIIRLQLGRIAQRMRENHNAQFTYSDELVDSIAGRCREVESGARNVDHILTRTLLPEISQEFLGRMAEAKILNTVHVSVDGEGGFQYEIT